MTSLQQNLLDLSLDSMVKEVIAWCCEGQFLFNKQLAAVLESP